MTGVLGISPAQAADAHSIIVAKTGADATLATSSQSVDGLTVSTGRDKAGKSLESWTQHTDAGVRMMSVLTEPGSVDFALAMPAGLRLAPMPDGGLIAVSTPEGPQAGIEARGAIDAPWAVDANGTSLPTSYTYANGVLTQNVNTSGAVFPVVVDPSLTFGWGVYFNLYGFEIKAVISIIVGGAGGALIAACLGSKLPTVVAKIVMVLCTIFGGPSVLSVLTAIYNYWKSKVINTYWCYQKEIIPMIGGWVAVPGAYPSTQNCRV